MIQVLEYRDFIQEILLLAVRQDIIVDLVPSNPYVFRTDGLLSIPIVRIVVFVHR